MTTFTEPTGEQWVRAVNKRLALLERIPRGGGTVSADDLSAGTSVAFEADVLMSSGTLSDPSLAMQDTEERIYAEDDPQSDPYLHEEYDALPDEGRTDLNYNPVTPTDPIIESKTGGVSVVWDGHGAGGEAIPVNLLLVEVHRSTDEQFIPDQTTYAGSLLDAGYIDFFDQEYEVPWYYRFVLLTNDGRRSTYTNAVLAVAHKVQPGEVGFSALDIDYDGAIGTAGTARTNYATNPRMKRQGVSTTFVEWTGVIWLDDQFDSVLDGGSPSTPLYSGVDGGSPSDTFTEIIDGGVP